MGFECNICGSTEVSRRVARDDGRWVLFCADCAMGVIADPPASTEAFYKDGYYGHTDANDLGYQDYAYNAEHGHLWAILLVQALTPSGGRVLDTVTTRLNLAYHVVHRFEPTAERVLALPALLDVASSPNLLKRLTELWHADSVNAGGVGALTSTAHWHEQQAHNWREAYAAIVLRLAALIGFWQ